MVTYTWYFSSSTISSSRTSMSQTFTSVGILQLQLTAVNIVSNVSYLMNITVVDRMSGIVFTSPTPYTDQSASIVNKQASFLFTLASGNGYTCVVDFGDGTSRMSFNDSAFDCNNTVVGHVYTREFIFKVSITCANSFNSVSYATDHHVQYEIANIR